jgi:hypothetical protein
MTGIETDGDEEAPSSLRVRPYTMTNGRTDTEVNLSLETMIHTVEGAEVDDRNATEAAAIVELCATEPLSIAEISAHLSLPLQVAKVLVGDLVTVGAVATHQVGLQPDGRPDLALLERVLDGLQSL